MRAAYTHLSLCVGDQLSGGSLQVGQCVAKHLRAGDGAHGCCCCDCCLTRQRIQLVRAKESFVRAASINVSGTYIYQYNAYS